MKIYALVGKSGTGKSYKALEIACENNINYIVDDGLFINNGKIIGGISAKQANTKIEAVRRAIFLDEKHRENVKKKINELEIENILILGTSIKMINKICNTLNLGKIYKIIDINDISTKEEIIAALESRKKGNHIIPVPTVEIKNRINGLNKLNINPLKRFFMTSNKKAVILEKTVIRPSFSYIGKFYISSKVLKQIIEYTVYQEKFIDNINRINISNISDKLDIKISININNIKVFTNLENVQKDIKKNIEETTLIDVGKIGLYIKKIKNK
ncbi:ATP-binding protein [Peptacetobacter sp.]|uniref:ATP-binding protein n=1 Tax=Peptacetobacter sp. TaxID=2991975 RepID=UPI00261D7404|nr:ATP-binding protein [Peptacetobacter sp.]